MKSPIQTRIALVMGFLLFSFALFAQEDIEPEIRSISLHIEQLGYFRNYEYYNDLQKGYTLFGTTLAPSVFVAASHTTHIEAGAFLQYDFGTDKFSRVLPLLAFVAEKKYYGLRSSEVKFFTPKEWMLRFGSLNNRDYHLMPEALYNQDQIVFDPLGYGEQFRYASDYFTTDQWVQWQRMIYHDSNGLEAFQAGFSLIANSAKDTTRWHLTVPVFALAHHHGGQIGTRDSIDKANSGTTLNLGTGLFIGTHFKSKVFTSIMCGGRYYHSVTDIKQKDGIPKTGNGVEAELSASFFDQFRLAVSYWQGKDFYAPYGRFITQSRSSIFTDKYAYKKDRQLIFVKAIYSRRIHDFLSFSIEVEPYYDINDKIIEYAFHALIRYQFSTLLYKKKE